MVSLACSVIDEERIISIPVDSQLLKPDSSKNLLESSDIIKMH